MIWTEPPAIHLPKSLAELHPLVAETLAPAWHSHFKATQGLLDPDAYVSAPATDLPGLAAAVDRLGSGHPKRQPICIWGDFDVDGQTSTTILVQTLRELDADVIFHIPVRANEGHGVNIPTCRKFFERGAKLILTCDTGITAPRSCEFRPRTWRGCAHQRSP